MKLNSFLIPGLLAFALVAAEPATAPSDPGSPTAEVAQSAELAESSQGTRACLAAQSIAAMPDCAQGCQNAARVATASGDPAEQVLERLHMCLDMCRA